MAIDGTQKLVRDTLWSEECLERKLREGEGTANTILCVFKWHEHSPDERVFELH
jgi:hypothetical protein